MKTGENKKKLVLNKISIVCLNKIDISELKGAQVGIKGGIEPTLVTLYGQTCEPITEKSCYMVVCPIVFG